MRLIEKGSKPALVIAGLTAMLGVSGRPAAGQVQIGAEIDIGVFHEELAPYGNWVEVENYGTVWTPNNMPPGWRPYTDGRWTYSDDYGWLWVSDLDWGWAPFHYGRWYFDDTFGWVWVPGTEWAPAWVAWRTSDDYVGWAPLPPRATWRAEIGLDLGGIDLDVAIGSRSWSFVEERVILEPQIRTRIILPARNVTLLRSTTQATRYTVREQRIVNVGLSIERVERRIGRPIPRARLRTIDSITTLRTTPRIVGSDVAVYRPRVVRTTTTRTPRLLTRRAAVATPREDVIIRQKTSRTAFKEHQRSEFSELESIHQRELQSASPTTRTQLLERHAIERRALEQDQRRGEAQIENWQRLEREGVVRGPKIRKQADDEKNGKVRKTTRKKRD